MNDTRESKLSTRLTLAFCTIAATHQSVAAKASDSLRTQSARMANSVDVFKLAEHNAC